MPARRKVHPDTAAPQAKEAGSELAALLGFRLRMAQATAQRGFSQVTEALGLTQPLAAILMLIDAEPGISQIAIAAALGSDRATVMALVDRLNDRGLLRRSRSETDRRKQELFLTDDGVVALADARPLIAQHEARLKALFTEGELTTLTGFLDRIRRLPPGN